MGWGGRAARRARVYRADAFGVLSTLVRSIKFQVLGVEVATGPSREELEDFLSESLALLTKLTHQMTQLRDYIEEMEGKTE